MSEGNYLMENVGNRVIAVSSVIFAEPKKEMIKGKEYTFERVFKGPLKDDKADIENLKKKEEKKEKETKKANNAPPFVELQGSCFSTNTTSARKLA